MPTQRRRRRRAADAEADAEGAAPAAPQPLAAGGHRVCMVSDFFHPGFGGVEIHIYNLARCLTLRGHKVIVVTREYEGGRQGVRWITGGIKVYHLPFKGVRLPPGIVTLPTMFGLLPLFRNVLIRERITLVHGHQTTSNMCHECMFHAANMGIPTCFTDHSLFGFADAASIHINKVLEFSLLSSVGHVICVSNTCRENTVLRAKIMPSKVSVIPNAADTSVFTPPEAMRGRTWGTSCADCITIVVITRLVYRKGADLLVDLIPEVCRRHPRVRWVVGGDGPRKLQVEQMIERNDLFARVELLGAVPHDRVPEVLRRGQIFVNTSLTEAFCIAILEAASCGLLVVSTGVGGVPEVLPTAATAADGVPEMLLLADPEPSSIAAAVDEAIRRAPAVSPWDFHEHCVSFYSWQDVADRTALVYNKVASCAVPDVVTRARRVWRIGPVYGTICVGISALGHLLWRVLRWLRPAAEVEPAMDYPVAAEVPG
eukprot:TRINITY_DN22211_c0_g1_i1.p1 TRINITY_DN22211_c0_g1~~TRINITY_DN22211_c0_g1_i1.p1  ORF type:complete len:485 (+),score=111.54 TRINITY_DN22211_c0_g1_i1:86-1540(+)